MILAIDTSLGTSVALVEDGRIFVERSADDLRRHAEVIGVLLSDVLDGRRSDVTAVVAGMGPGAFTGLRVGIAAARAAAFGLGVPVHGVCSHIAVAEGEPGLVQVTTDVRRRERAWSLHRDGVLVDGPVLAPADNVPVLPGASRIDATWISAGRLALAATSAQTVDQAMYLRDADAVPPASVKRVLQ